MGLFRQLRMRLRLKRALRDFDRRHYQPKPHSLPKPLYVSLTSYAARFGVLHLTLRGLLTQTVKPDAVFLWVSAQDMVALPEAVRVMQAQGLIIRATDNLRSYTKLIPMLLEAPEAYIVTADDDVFYHAEWLEELVRSSVTHPGEVISHRAHRIRYRRDGAIASYEKWKLSISGDAAGRDIFATGVGGVLYPPGSLHSDTTNIELFQRLAPSSDDLWFYWMACRQGTIVRHIGPRRRVIEWPDSQVSNLRSLNRGEAGNNGNDLAIAALMAHYSQP